MIRPQCLICGSQQYYYPLPPSGNTQGQKNLMDQFCAYAAALITRNTPINELMSYPILTLTQRTCELVKEVLVRESPVCLCKSEEIRRSLTRVIMSQNTNN